MKSKYEETIRLLSDKELRFHLYLTQLLLLFIALVIGLFLFHSWDSFLRYSNGTDHLLRLV